MQNIVFNWIKKHVVYIIAVVIIIATIVAPLLINNAYISGEGYQTVWGGADVLSYFGAVISAVGTMILGVIAWQQNARLLKLEEHTFLAENAGSALLKEITVTGRSSMDINFYNHEEQIVFTKDSRGCQEMLNYGSIEIVCKLKPFSKEQHVALVNIKDVILAVSKGKEDKQVILSANNADKQYSRVAISRDCDRFKFTLIMSREEKEKFIKAVNDKYSVIIIDMVLSLMNDKYVETELKCRARLGDPEYDEKEGIYSRFKTSANEPPMCFWYGASVLSKRDIIIKSIGEGTHRE